MNSRVSVLIVSYNSGNYIKKTIQSILDQTYDNIEVLILDNNSKDNTIHNIKKFMKKHKNIKLFTENKNIGCYKGINYLLERANGAYIAIIDHDDIRHPEKIERQITFLEKEENKKYVGCGTETIMYYESDKTYFKYFLNKKNFYTIHSSLVFRNIGNIYYDKKLDYLGDSIFQKESLCKGKKLIYNIKEPLTLHLIKNGYGNYTYSRFKLKRSYIKRLFDLHGFKPYTFFFLGYEIFRKILLLIMRIIPNEKMFVFFDRLPYKAMGNKISKISSTKDKYIQQVRDSFLK